MAGNKYILILNKLKFLEISFNIIINYCLYLRYLFKTEKVLYYNYIQCSIGIDNTKNIVQQILGPTLKTDLCF